MNELNSERALKTLKLWVEHNPNFQSMEVVVDAYSDGSLMDEVMQLMISAQKAALAHGGDDSDVNIVLVRAVFDGARWWCSLCDFQYQNIERQAWITFGTRSNIRMHFF